ncbi:MAG: hypothetical protein ACQEV7_15590, partial [Bacillota bacterium]
MIKGTILLIRFVDNGIGCGKQSSGVVSGGCFSFCVGIGLFSSRRVRMKASSKISIFWKLDGLCSGLDRL